MRGIVTSEVPPLPRHGDGWTDADTGEKWLYCDGEWVKPPRQVAGAEVGPDGLSFEERDLIRRLRDMPDGKVVVEKEAGRLCGVQRLGKG